MNLGSQELNADRKLTASLVLIENQLDFFSDEMDVLASLIDETNHIFLSTINHLTHDLMSESELKQESNELNNILQKRENNWESLQKQHICLGKIDFNFSSMILFNKEYHEQTVSKNEYHTPSNKHY